jgi:hypothetical protein
MSFPEFWLAMGRTGNEGYARAKWGKLSAAEKAAIQERLSHPRSWAADMWAGKWLECRIWEETPPAAASANRPEQVYIREGTPEWRAWQRHLVATTGRGTPMDSRGGWYFPSKLPPLEAETPPKAHAHSSLEPLGFLRAVSANVVHNISHDGAETGPIEWHSTFEAHCRRTL